MRATLAIATGKAVPPAVTQAFGKLPGVMARADALAGRIDRAVVDLAEAAMLAGREGEVFAATVTQVDDRGAQVQLRDMAVVARVATPGATPGATLNVRLIAADPAARTISFAVAA